MATGKLLNKALILYQLILCQGFNACKCKTLIISILYDPRNRIELLLDVLDQVWAFGFDGSVLAVGDQAIAFHLNHLGAANGLHHFNLFGFQQVGMGGIFQRQLFHVDWVLWMKGILEIVQH
jgi:hypothetical protein